MRVRGEDLLGEPDTYLRKIAEWLGLRTDEEAIEAMKHPEQSPYACIGPENALLAITAASCRRRPCVRTPLIKK